MIQKSIGKFLNKKKSWNRVIHYLRKKLHRYEHWDYTYEFDEGNIRIIIHHNSSNKVQDESKVSQIGNETASDKVKQRKRKKAWL